MAPIALVAQNPEVLTVNPAVPSGSPVAAATDFGKLEDGSFFLVLEYVEGKSLREELADGRLELGQAIHIANR